MNTSKEIEQFQRLLKLSNIQEKEEKIIKLIDESLLTTFKDDNRYWFNNVCENGLINVVLHCMNTIDSFSLYDHEKEVNNISNVSLLWSIRSGNLPLIILFFQDETISLFKNRKNIEKDIIHMLTAYKEKKDFFDIDNFGKVIYYLIEKLPLLNNMVFDMLCRQNNKDELTDLLTDLLSKYKNEYFPNLSKNDNDLFTIHCILSVKQKSFKFAQLLRSEYGQLPLNAENVEMILYWIDRNIEEVDWIINNPSFFKLEKENFKEIFKKVFLNPLSRKIKKEDYNYFNSIVSYGLHEVSIEEYRVSIMKNFSPIVRKYYSKFKKEDLSGLYIYNNAASCFLENMEKKKLYKALMKKMPIAINTKIINKSKI